MSNHEAVIADKLPGILEKQKEGRINTESFYELIKDELDPKVTLAEFRPISGAFFNKSTEYESIRGRFGGIKKRGSKPVRNVDDILNKDDLLATDITEPYVESDSDESEDGGTTIMLNKALRIRSTDSRNWTIQRLNGEQWVSKWYPGGDLSEALKFAAYKILNGEFQASKAMVPQLKDLAELVKQCEKRVFAKLEEVSKQSAA